MADMVDTVRTATNRMSTVVLADKLDYAGTLNYFETSQAITDTATLTIDVVTNITGLKPKRFWIDEIRYYMNPTNPVTYTLYLLEGAAVDDLTQKSKVVWQSAAGMVDGTEYVWRHVGFGSFPNPNTVDASLPCICALDTVGKLYYIITWTGAPGDTPGYIKVKGRLLK